jgi:myo-inositol-1-phosphate synthase
MLIDGNNDFFVLDEKKARAHKKDKTKSQQVQNRGRNVGSIMKQCI